MTDKLNERLIARSIRLREESKKLRESNQQLLRETRELKTQIQNDLLKLHLATR